MDDMGGSKGVILDESSKKSKAVYNQSLGDTHHTVWPSELCYSDKNSEIFRKCPPRFPVYPQNPGQYDCPQYMRTRTCKDGDSCKFDHPLFVPEGGIPGLKEVPVMISEPLPERPGKQVCPLLLMLKKCKYGQACRFHHPKSDVESTGISELLKRPVKPLSKFTTAGSDNGNGGQIGALVGGINEQSTLSTSSSTPAASPNSGIPNCNFDLKNGSCSFGSGCNNNHPERDAMDPPGAIVAAPASHINHVKRYKSRPGKKICDHYMKTGKCSFKRCKYDHPPRT